MMKCIRLFIMILVLAAVVFFGYGIVLDNAGRYLVEKDELKPADVIVVLGGEVAERVEYGVKLFREGWSRKDRVIMTGGPVVGKHTYAGLMKEQAEELGLPGRAILLADRSRSTEQDAQGAGEILKRYGYNSIILVTSPYHSRRASIIFRKALPGIRVISAPADKSWLNFDKWWKRPRDRDMVLNEWLKFVKLWIFGVQNSRPVVSQRAG